MNNKPWIYPEPKQLFLKENGFCECEGVNNVTFLQDPKLPKQGYSIDINKERVAIYSSTPEGKYYGTISLNQLLQQYGNNIPCLYVEDAPDFDHRGVLLDIGRDKIPTMKSLYELIDILAGLKFNQLQLYMEGYAFEYQEFKSTFPGETPITAEEFRQLDVYAQDRFIDLVPNQNCFGHMAPWLAKDEFKDLAENSTGAEVIPGLKMEPATLNPLDPNSIDLVKKTLDELLPQFTSEYVNIGLDEPFELGTGKSKEICERKGVGQVYLEFLLKVVEITKKHGKKPMFWGDIILNHPELVKKLPKDITIMDWNYEGDVSFQNHCKILSDTSMNFYVCPGTSAWGSIAGRTSNMNKNIINAAEKGKKYGAKGILITDWGDMGHWQPPVISYPGYVLGAAASWNVKESKNADIARYLDQFIFMDKTHSLGEMALELGDYTKMEGINIPNFTLIFSILAIYGVHDKEVLEMKINQFLQTLQHMMSDDKKHVNFELNPDIHGLRGLFNHCEAVLEHVDLKTKNANLIVDEYKNTIFLLKHGINLMELIMNEEKLNINQRAEQYHSLQVEIMNFVDHYKGLWRKRNREGGLDRSIVQFLNLRNQYKKREG